MRIKCLAQKHYCRCKQIRTGNITIESPWCYPLSQSSSSFNKFWMAWLLISMWIQEIMSRIEDRDYFSHFYNYNLFFGIDNKTWNCRCQSHKLAYLPKLPFKSRSSFRERCERFHVTDGHFFAPPPPPQKKKKKIEQHPRRKWFHLRMFAPWNFLRNLYFV